MNKLFKFNKKGFKAFYDECGFNTRIMKLDILWACGIVSTEDIRWMPDYEQEAVKEIALGFNGNSAYIENEKVGLIRILFSPVAIAYLMFAWALQLAWLIGTFPFVVLHNIKFYL